MRCPDCNKFVSYDEPQCSVDSVDISGDELTAEVVVALPCADCGTELKEYHFSTTATIAHECKEKVTSDPLDVDDEQNEIEDDRYQVVDEGTPEGTERLENKDKFGKPITNPRYMKRFYGYEMAANLLCTKCMETFCVAVSDEEQASSFDELC